MVPLLNFAYELAAAKISDYYLQGLDLSSWRGWRSTARNPSSGNSLDRFSTRFAQYGFRREVLYPSTASPNHPLPLRSLRVGPGGPRVDRIERAAFECDGRAIPSHSDDVNVISFVSVGPPVPRHEVRIANERGEDAGERVEGQLWFRGASATQGYYENASETAALFPRGAAVGWINSGDRAYQAEGEIYITGRVKDIIIHAGRNLYPHEIEDIVAHVPGVRKGCVVAFGAADPKTGTERLVVIAETRENDVAPRVRIAQAINAQVSIAPWVRRRMLFKWLARTRFQKLRAENCNAMPRKKDFFPANSDSGVPPVWMQIGRLAVKIQRGPNSPRCAFSGRRRSHTAVMPS